MNKIPANSKFVVKSTTKISLNDRFTELRKIAPVVQAPIPAAPKQRQPPPIVKQLYEPSPVRPRYDMPYHPGHRTMAGPDSDEDDPYEVHDRYQPVGRNRSLAERIAAGVYLPRRRPAFEAALKIKQRSIQHRLGGSYGGNYSGFQSRPSGNWQFNRYRGGGGQSYGGSFRGWRPRYNLRYNNRGFGGQRGFRRSRSFQNLRRWESSTSLASDGTGFRRRSHSAGSGRGGYRGGRGGYNFRRGGGGGAREEISKDALDAELDEYMTGTQNVIDVDAEA